SVHLLSPSLFLGPPTPSSYTLSLHDALPISRWAHDGVAEGGDCMTCSIGFRAPQRGGLAGELLQRMADALEDDTLYRDPGQAATATPARMPEGLAGFAAEGLQRLLGERDALGLALGEVMTEPKPHTWFDEPVGEWRPTALWL